MFSLLPFLSFVFLRATCSSFLPFVNQNFGDLFQLCFYSLSVLCVSLSLSLSLRVCHGVECFAARGLRKKRKKTKSPFSHKKTKPPSEKKRLIALSFFLLFASLFASLRRPSAHHSNGCLARALCVARAGVALGARRNEQRELRPCVAQRRRRRRRSRRSRFRLFLFAFSQRLLAFPCHATCGQVRKVSICSVDSIVRLVPVQAGAETEKKSNPADDAPRKTRTRTNPKTGNSSRVDAPRETRSWRRWSLWGQM